ncbi:hypothetical protein ASG35_17685 [Burkholderia sp. Leaf177]|uniref:hypothetical protein n=1 Tax=Burkholderia sp. Leaf177 TaxID=1736287 RepID=UPI0006FFC37F|nr:hypothetical protein [Burkholderia sp. Leaf177]KQR74583.1 hypothetical protein ASG35_17685 [Burkholderia sp. Leaf177]
MKIAPIRYLVSLKRPSISQDNYVGLVMNFPWFPLLLNFVLLAAAILICNVLNNARREPFWNGALIFVGFCLLAMTLDFVLTFVFASATTTDKERYIDLSSLSACGERAIAYAIPCAVAAVMALRFRLRDRSREEPSVMIQTSEYTQSELRY